VAEWDENSYLRAITAIRPEQPAPVTTSLVNLNVRLSWAHPFNNYQDIQRYEIQIKDQTGNYHYELTSCDGDLFSQATKSDEQLDCDVSVKEVLLKTPFLYSFD